MESSASSSTQSASKDSRWIMWALIIVVSVDSLVRIFVRWHIYGYLTRTGAVLFAFLLLAFPVKLMLGFRRGKPVETEQIVVFAYMNLLVMTTFFLAR
jgi:hypothetical protein